VQSVAVYSESEDERYMRLALDIASLAQGQTSPNPLVGAVLVKDGYIVGQGAHLRAGDAHAEVNALRMAGDRAKGATLYVTLEPCSHFGRTPPCADAVVRAGVARVVIANVDPDARVAGSGIARLRENGIDVRTGVRADEGERLNEAYFHAKRFGRPFVIWKCAATLDGYIATATGDSFYVTSTEARSDVQRLRATVSAIAVGIGTALADDPRLTVRLHADDADGTATRQPVRVVFDTELRLPLTARMLQASGTTVIFAAEDCVRCNERTVERLASAGATVVALPRDHNRRLSLDFAFRALLEKGLHSVLLEGGAALASACLQAHLVDKVVYYIAPKLLGGGLSSLTGMGLTRMAEAITLRDAVHTVIGTDTRITGYPVYANTVVREG